MINKPDYNALQPNNRFDELYTAAKKLDKHRLDAVKISRSVGKKGSGKDSVLEDDVPEAP